MHQRWARIWVAQPQRPGSGCRENEREHGDHAPTGAASSTRDAHPKRTSIGVAEDRYLYRNCLRQARDAVRQIRGFVFPHGASITPTSGSASVTTEKAGGTD
jgi:hypothetical protein